MRPNRFRRAMIAFVAISLIGAAILVAPPTGAQDGDSERQLTPNEPVTGSLDAENFAESFIFEASEGNTISLTATTSAEDLSLALILTDPNGDVVASDGDLSTPQSANIPDLTLETDGTYVVTVLRGTGADGDAEGEYSLTLTGEITPPEDTAAVPTTIRDGDDVYIVLEDGGIEFALQWSAAVDFNLEVRDPVGGALFFDSLSVNSGGEHSGDVNDVCDNATSDNPTETISWPEGSVPVGSYEIIVYYEQACSVGGPQSFVLTATVDGEESQVVNGILNPDQNHLARMVLDVDRGWSVFNGGVNPGNLDLTPVASPQVATIGQSVTGTLTNEKPKDGYTFEASTGQTVSIDMAATSGSLDTLLIVLGPDGRLVASNDDRTDGGTTDSGLQIALTADGTYTIIATRYGQVIGGTEGNYTLFVDIGSSSTVLEGTTTADTDDSTVITTAPPSGSIQVTLQWFTNADMQLQVRDPSGATVFDDEATIASGGILDQTRVGNRGCELAVGTPTYYIYWPTTRIPPAGTYEVEVWFQDDCDDPTPVSFGLTVTVNGQTLKFDDSQATTTTATASTEGNRYMLNFTIDNAGTATLGEGGFFSMDVNNIAASLDFDTQLGTATPLEYNETVQGRIDQNQKFVVYSFEGRTGDRVGVGMTRIGQSSLDTAVYIIGPGNIPLIGNDDIAPGENTNSLIQDIDLLQDGTYYIIATHYGLRYGATAGEFTMTLDLLN